MNVGLTLAMPTDTREFIAAGGERFPDACVIERDRFGGVSVLVWGGIMGCIKTCLIVIYANINAQTYINDVLTVKALPFIHFNDPKCHIYAR